MSREADLLCHRRSPSRRKALPPRRAEMPQRSVYYPDLPVRLLRLLVRPLGDLHGGGQVAGEGCRLKTDE